ncbi:hypothetical protein WJU23_05385 [Prosthecobacter sp. SYSU 5D2]|uniref:hypothetical protein n=1 Tax=Prosthecobacter sp. SYSU 5D2 TaxID=3134134 RepID=UPI0031FE6842
MASTFKALKMPPDLAEIAEIRAEALGYPSWAAYVKGLIRHDAGCLARHGITVPWSKMALTIQDKLDALLLWRVKKGKGMKSAEMTSWDWESEYEAMMKPAQ